MRILSVLLVLFFGSVTYSYSCSPPPPPPVFPDTAFLPLLLDSTLTFRIAASDVEELGVLLDQRKYAYDTRGNLCTEYWTIQDDRTCIKSTDQEQKRYFRSYTYDEGSSLIEASFFIYREWDWGCAGNEYHPRNEVYQYDEHGRVWKKTQYFCNDQDGIISTTQIHYYTYDSDNRLIREVCHSYPDEMDTWEIAEKSEYSYHSDGRLREKRTHEYEDRKWVEKEHVKHYYETNRLSAEVKTRHVYENTHTDSVEYMYNDSGTLTYKYFHDSDSIYRMTKYNHDHLGRVTDIIEYEGENESRRTFLYWSSLPTGQKDKEALMDLIIFPNPADRYFHLECNYSGELTLALFSSDGQLVSVSDKVRTPCRIDVSNLKSGIYFLTVRSKDFVISKKIIKQS